MRRYFVGVGCAAFVALVAMSIGACGKVDPDDSTFSSNDDDAGSSYDALISSTYDGSPTFSDAGIYVPPGYDASPPDGGPIPMPPCLDAGLSCPLPASLCIDDRWLRYYASGSCDTDAGVCDFVASELDCETLGNACYNGGCNTVIIR
jgi:hypothetical protein